MSKNRSHRIDRDTAEQLLGGAAVGSEAGPASLTGHAALAGLLAAAAAPPTDGALPGEEQAVAAFREARRTPAPHPGRATMADHARRRTFTLKALVAAFAVTAVGGVAVAAGTGNLPEALGGSPAKGHASVAPAASPADPASASRAGSTPSGRPTASGSADRTDTAASPSAGSASAPASALPDLTALCQVWTDRSHSGTKQRDLLAEPRMAPLVAAAGGAAKVDSYCKSGKGGTATASPSATTGAGHGGQPSASPTKGERTPARTATQDLPEVAGQVGAAVR
ncbi:hypothetical protein [Kitasatospora sp. DSM 101779]|uniref:hypothetical protein n=1 Tax=Kitasatospora sp. DSM 101779 TaxID=2853165 RepID=UPI0021D8DDF4|nr:hypothetical protein [Kitasatospora sp. DSM 101779]MCU7824016.1 hypothetical protein [Kitasatospora sp. DSM 101779]